MKIKLPHYSNIDSSGFFSPVIYLSIFIFFCTAMHIHVHGQSVGIKDPKKVFLLVQGSKCLVTRDKREITFYFHKE